ncbi:MAG TPA: hypothetical protein PKC98_10060, partial [Candidatus Melainabacteria bacterium]|nr:hypothetical protein [Candidatus Melainabacteria bacterium]
MVDTASIIGTSQTIRLTGAEIEKPPEKGGFLSGLTDGGAKIVTGMAKMVLNEEKTSEQRAKDADRSLAGNLVNTGHTLATTVTDSQARAAIGDAIADQTKKVLSGDTYAIGETTAFVGSFFIPGAATAKGTSGLTNTGRALNTATKMDDALGLVSRVKPGSVIDDVATKFRPGSVLDDAARANPAVTLGDDASAIAARTAKPGPVIPSSPSFSTRLSTTVEDLSQAARSTVDKTIEAFTGRSVPKLATETGTGATLRTGNGSSLLEGLGVKTPGNVTPGRFTLPRTGKPGSILDEIGTGSLADDVARGPKPVVAERAPVIREAKPVVHEANPVVREAGDVKPVVREAGDVKPVVREVGDVKPVIREAQPVIREARPVVTRTLEESKGAIARQTENAGTALRQTSDDFTSALDDLATKSGPQARGPIQSVKQLTEEIRSGNAGAEAMVKLEQSMKDLGRALPENLADDFSRLATKADDLKMATGRNTATREISTGVKEAADTAVAAERTLGQASRNFNTSLDDLVRNVAKEDPALARTLRTKVDDIKVISEKLATGADDTAA